MISIYKAVEMFINNKSALSTKIFYVLFMDKSKVWKTPEITHFVYNMNMKPFLNTIKILKSMDISTNWVSIE